jgi:hypothetical protein
VWSRGGRAVGIEVKAAKRWQDQYSRALRELHAARAIARAFGVYLGAHHLKDAVVEVFPLQQFLQKLHAGEILR